jgi:hypothetical protein
MGGTRRTQRAQRRLDEAKLPLEQRGSLVRQSIVGNDDQFGRFGLIEQGPQGERQHCRLVMGRHDYAERDRRGASASGFCGGFRQAEGLPDDEGEKRRAVTHVDDADRPSQQAVEDEGAGKKQHPKQRDTAVDENARQRRRRRREPG